MATQIVREMIEESLAEKPWVSIYYLMGEIQNRVDPIQLCNAAIAAGVDCDNGGRHLNAGAEAVVNDALIKLTEADYTLVGSRRQG